MNGRDDAGLEAAARWMLLDQLLAGTIGYLYFGWLGLLCGAVGVQIIGWAGAWLMNPRRAAPPAADSARRSGPLAFVTTPLLLVAGMLAWMVLLVAGAIYWVVRAVFPTGR